MIKGGLAKDKTFYGIFLAAFTQCQSDIYIENITRQEMPYLIYLEPFTNIAYIGCFKHFACVFVFVCIIVIVIIITRFNSLNCPLSQHIW